MKKFLLILIAIASVFTACKKDQEVPERETLELSLQQRWKNVAAYTEYYDSLGVKVYTEKDPTLADIEFGADFRGNISISDSSVLKSLNFKYQIEQKNQRTFLAISAASFGSDRLVVEKLSPSTLILSSDAAEPGYFRNGNFYPASRSVYIQEYIRY